MGETYLSPSERLSARLQTYVPPPECAEPLADLARIPPDQREVFIRQIAQPLFVGWEMHYECRPGEANPELEHLINLASSLNDALGRSSKHTKELFQLFTGRRFPEYQEPIAELLSALSFSRQKLGLTKRTRGGQRKSGRPDRPAWEIFIAWVQAAACASGGKLTARRGATNPGTLYKFAAIVTPRLPPGFFSGLSLGALHRITNDMRQ